VEALVLLSWFVGVAAMLFKWALVNEFHRERSPGITLFQIHWKMNFMTWKQRREYRREFVEFLRRSDRVWYNRILNVAMMLCLAGFIIFGRLADAQLPKHKRPQSSALTVKVEIVS
jgi:hypothetical protein